LSPLEVILQGDPADAVFYIRKGKVKSAVISKLGKQAVVVMLGAGDFFGEGCLVGQKHRLSTLTSMTDSVLVRWEKKAFIRALREDSALVDMFIRRILGRSSRVEADLVDQMFNSSEKRLARHLLLLANFGQEAGSQAEIEKISQETLADMIGTTRSRVSRFMNKFRKLGLIDYAAGQVTVYRSLANYLLHDQPTIKS
jgi:CRP/FNR family transcriptional regulator, cyclic AMP receptor protein